MAIASLLVRIGAEDSQIQNALASVGQKAKSVDADLKKLGNTPLASQAQKSLDSLHATMKQVTDAQQRVAERAKFAAQGIELMGGAGALSTAQLKQMNRTLQEGVSSYQALGQKAPQELQKVADAVSGKLDKPMVDINAKVMALATAIGTFLGQAAVQAGRALIDAGKAAFDYADSLSNLSVSTGITIEGLQRIEALGTTTGVSMDTLATAVGMLQKNLDNPAAMKALAQMGLNYQHIRNLKPEDQFLEIAKSVAAIEDPVERANAGAALFGRQWATIAPAIAGDIDKIIKGVKTLSDEQVKALDAAGDAWDKWKRDSQRSIASMLGSLVLAAQKSKIAWKDLLTPSMLGFKLTSGNEAVAADFLSNMPTAKPAPPLELPRGMGATSWAEVEAIVERTNEEIEKSIRLNTKHADEAERANKRVTDSLERVRYAHYRLTEAAIAVSQNVAGFGIRMSDTVVIGKDYSQMMNAAQVKTNALGITLRADLAPSLEGIGGAMHQAGLRFDGAATLAEQMRDRFKSAFGQIPDILRSAFTGGGGLIGAMKAFGVQMADALTGPLLARFSGMAAKWGGAIAGMVGGGAKSAAASTITGTAINVGSGLGGAAAAGSTAKGAAIIGGIGMNPATIAWTAGISAAVVGIYVGVKKLKEQRAHMEVNRLRDAFFNMQGGLEGLNPRVLELTGNLESVRQLFAARNAQQWGAAVENINAILEVGRQRFTELQGAVGTVGEKLTGLTVLTPDIKSALDAVFDQSTTQGYLDKVKELNGELDKQAGRYDLIRGTLEKYGLEVTEAMDPVFRQQNTNASALTLRKDFDVLKGSGVDLNHAMEKMGPSLNKFVKEAKIAGVEVPESMRPVLQTAIDAGELFDRSTQKIGKNGEALEANGEKWDDQNHKITDISQLGLTFGTTMETVMTKTIPDAIGKLTKVLEGLAKFLGIDLGEAAKDGAADVNDALGDIEDPEITVRVNVPDIPDIPVGYSRDVPGGYGGYDPNRGVPEFATGSGGIRDFGTGTLAMLHGREAVVTEADMRSGAAVASSQSAATSIVVNVRVDGIFSENDLVQTIQRRMEPILRQTWEDNVAGSRTNLQDVLGVT